MQSDIAFSQLSLNDEERWKKIYSKSINPFYKAAFQHKSIKQSSGRESTCFVFHKNDEDVAGVHYSLKSIKGLICSADIRSGIICNENFDKTVLGFIIEHFIDWARQKGACFATIDPTIPILVDGMKKDYSIWIDQMFKEREFRVLSNGRHSYWVDLTLPEEQLLKRMKRQTRYEIKRGLKSDIEIIPIDKPKNDIIDRFWKLYSALGHKKRFATMSEKKFKNEVILLIQNNLAVLFVAYYSGIIINISLCSKTPISSYMLGAMNPDFKTLNDCPSPGQLVQWYMMNYMKNNGAHIYDLGFCPGPVPDPKHKAYHVWRFKYGFGGDHVQFMPTYGKVLKPIRGKLYEMVRYRRKERV